jgi:hypothetical protein
MAAAVDADPAFMVSIEMVDYCPPASMVSVVPASASDWELVESRADLVTSTMETCRVGRGRVTYAENGVRG